MSLWESERSVVEEDGLLALPQRGEESGERRPLIAESYRAMQLEPIEARDDANVEAAVSAIGPAFRFDMPARVDQRGHRTVQIDRVNKPLSRRAVCEQRMYGPVGGTLGGQGAYPADASVPSCLLLRQRPGVVSFAWQM
jgi:hypothetical protein